MQIAEPLWLAVAAVAALSLSMLAIVDARRRTRAVERFASPALAEALTGAVARKRRAVKIALVTLAMVCGTVALARPAWGWRWEDAQRSGTDILFAIDTSKSMLAEDLRPNRLARAKLAVTDLVEQFEGDRAGLIAFAGAAFLESPMTLDRGAFQRSLDMLDTSIIPRGGTDVAAAIRESIAAITPGVLAEQSAYGSARRARTAAGGPASRSIGESDHEKIVVLLTDGESLEGDALTAAEEARAAGVRIFTVGLGSADGSPIPVRGPDGAVTLLRDPTTNELAVSRLGEASLRRIAEITGGAYAALGQDGHGLTQLWRDHLASLPSHAVAARPHRVFTERFQWPLALALALMLIEPLVGERRRARQRRRAQAIAFAAGAALLAIPALALASPREAEEAYRRGEFERAQEEFLAAADEADDPAAMHFNAGAAAYRAGDHEGAIAAMDRALRSRDLSVQQSAYYDRGNAQYRAGQATLAAEDREATKASWRAAIASYEAALALEPDDEDARFNLELVRRKLAELEAAAPPPDEGEREDESGGESGGESEGEGEGEGESEGESEGQGDSESERQPPSDPADATPAGRLSREEALQLLRSLGDGAQRFPFASPEAEPGAPDESYRDW